MKILYICNEYPPFVHGGIGSFTRDIAESMHKKGNEVHVWGVYDTIDSDTTELQNEISVHRIKGRKDGGRLNTILFRYDFFKKLNQFLKTNQFDIVECQEWRGLLPYGNKHKGFVVRLHGAAIFFDSILKRPGNRLIHFFEKMMMKRSANLVAVSDFCGKETLKYCGIPNKKFHIIYNSVDIEKLLKFKKGNFQQQKIVFANSVLRKKGVFELVEAFNTIAVKYPNAELHIIGKLGYSENGVNVKDLLEKTVDEQFKNRLHVRGWLDKADDVYHELSDAHVCCYPSHMEGFGIAPVEPMAMGKPVLFMNNGPGSEVIEDEVSGLLVDSTSALDIANKITRLFEDEELCERLSKEATIRAKKLFDKDQVFSMNNINYYKMILNED